MKKRPTISIGIPALNEEANIRAIIECVQKQSQTNYEIVEIIVISDGSTDQTAEIVKQMKENDIRIHLVNHRDRAGQAARLNEIVSMFAGDYLLLLNADVLIMGTMFMDNMITPLVADPQVGLVGARVVSIQAQTFVEKIVNWSVTLKQDVYEQIEDGNHILMCHGRARAFKRDFAKQIIWPRLAAEDAYSYLICKDLGFEFYYQPKAVVLYRSPQTVKDHLKQSVRFVQGQNVLSKEFSAQLVENSLSVWSSIKNYPGLWIKTYLKHLLASPILGVGYFVLLFISLLISFTTNNSFAIATWKVSKTSKILTQ